MGDDLVDDGDITYHRGWTRCPDSQPWGGPRYKRFARGIGTTLWEHPAGWALLEGSGTPLVWMTELQARVMLMRDPREVLR